MAPVALLLSSPSQTLRLTPLTSALRAARAHDAVLRMYPDLPLRFIKIHGDILVSYAEITRKCVFFRGQHEVRVFSLFLHESVSLLSFWHGSVSFC